MDIAKIVLAGIAAVGIASVAGSASADVGYVPEIAVPGLPDLAVTEGTPTGPVIKYNPAQCAAVGPAVCKFARQHEYGHVNHHDVYNAWTQFTPQGRAAAEEAADCYAAKRITDSEARAVIAFLEGNQFASMDPIHGSALERAARVRQCHSFARAPHREEGRWGGDDDDNPPPPPQPRTCTVMRTEMRPMTQVVPRVMWTFRGPMTMMVPVTVMVPVSVPMQVPCP